ncbi:MAG TPA: hypothetical protein VM364_18580 [Vicinamibacterales bacterium]|nr:hypothetical protein [Vicinamibacterales bacterium]
MKTNGTERCRHYALRGSKVCKYHGGAAPQVQRAAEARRMTDLYGPMLAGLRRLLDSGDLDAIAKACAILARQYGNDVEANRLPEHSRTNDHAWVEWLTDEELHAWMEMSNEFEAVARERMETGVEVRNGQIVSGPRLPVIDVQSSAALPNDANEPHLTALQTQAPGDHDAQL